MTDSYWNRLFQYTMDQLLYTFIYKFIVKTDTGAGKLLNLIANECSPQANGPWL